jgi:hypothetical protein
MTTSLPLALLKQARPKQWAKNLLVFAAPGAAGVLDDGSYLWRTLVVFVAFCMVSSGTYYWNDLLDVESDRQHPTNRNPPIASVGVTETEARTQFDDVKVYKSDFRAMKNVLADRNERAIYKMVVAGPDERVVGLHLIGPDSGEILQAAAIAVKAGLSKQDFDDTVALHPSMSEELVLMK